MPGTACKRCRWAVRTTRSAASTPVGFPLQGIPGTPPAQQSCMHALSHRAANDPPPVRTDVEPPAMVWTARPDLSCESVSLAWCEFTGHGAEQALGEGWSRCLHPEDLARWLDACVRAFDARTSFELEYRMRRRDGQYRWVLDRARPRYSREGAFLGRSEEHTSELQSQSNLVCRLLLEKKKT